MPPFYFDVENGGGSSNPLQKKDCFITDCYLWDMVKYAILSTLFAPLI